MTHDMERFCRWMVLVLLSAYALAIPTGNSTTIANSTITNSRNPLKTYGSTPGLQATFATEPLGRGTVGILISCTATFFFCTWTAMYPNIIPGVSSWYRLYHRLILMGVSIVTPEGILICAMGEFRDAKRLRDAWVADIRIPQQAKSMLDMEAAFFVVMGGFVVDELELHDETQGVPAMPYRATLTPTGFRKYLKEGLIHEQTFDQAMIRDKCKASKLAKSLAAAQALWLVVQGGARWGQALPLTLLEVHVLIRVVNTALIYGFWWAKPLDINEPIMVKLQKLPEKELQPQPPSPESDRETSSSPLSEETDSGISPLSPTPETQTVEQNRFFTSQTFLADEARKTAKYSPNEPAILTIGSPKNLLSISCKAIYDILTQIDIGERTNRQDRTTIGGPEPLQTKHSSRYQTEHSSPHSLKFNIGMFGQASLVCLTGALHAIAWNSHFSTNVEHRLWQISSLAMCFCCLGIFLISNFTEYEQDLIAAAWAFHLKNRGQLLFPIDALLEIHSICVRHAKTADNKIRPFKYICHQLGIWTALLFVGVYMCSVIFLTVESYLSLRTPLPEHFITPNWTNYWPHL